MSKMHEIKALQLQARKAGQGAVASLYTTLLGEAAMIGKNQGNRETTDAEVVAIVQKFLKNIAETKAALERAGKATDVQEKEATLLEALLPKQLTESEMQALATEWGVKTMPEWMQRLKAERAGQYDGKLASSVGKARFG